MILRIQKNRSTLTGRFLPGVSLIDEDGYWVGPGLGDFRSAAEAKSWAASQPAWMKLSIA